MKSPVLEHVFFEIAMSMGESLDIEVMLARALTTYLRKLNCLAGAVLELHGDEEEACFRKVYAIPRMPGTGYVLDNAFGALPTSRKRKELDAFFETLPVTGSDGEYAHHIMNLPGFGLLILIKSGEVFETPVIKSLRSINSRLANFCISCRNNEQLELVNARLQQEMAIRKTAEENYRGIFDNAVEGIFQTSLDGQVLRANPALARMLGYESPDEFTRAVNDVGRQIYAHEEDRHVFLSRLRRNRQVRGMEALLRRRDGSTIWASMSAILVRDHNGRPSHIEGVLEDISDRKKTEAALHQAKEEAEKHSQLTTNFISMVSHELRTPLTSIYGFARMLEKNMKRKVLPLTTTEKERAEVKRMAENCAIIASEGQRLTELVKTVLDISRLDSGRFNWNTTTTSMLDVVETSLAETEHLFQEKNIRLIRELATDLPNVTVDRERLIKVCSHLLANAAKFTAMGTVTCSLSLENGEIRVCVADSGPGVAPEERENIFDMFKQLGEPLTDKPKGTGLGLPVCRKIVSHFGGSIWVEGTHGATFCFTVPVDPD